MTKQTKYTLYQISGINNEPIYIGITKNYAVRVYYHDYATRTPDKQVWNSRKKVMYFPHRTYLYNKLRDLVKNNIDYNVKEHIKVIAEYETYELLLEAEIEKIRELRKTGIILCNITNGGEGTPGRKPIFTDKWRANLSAAARERCKKYANPMQGVKLSKESISKALATRKSNILSGKTKDYNADRIGKTNIELYGAERAREINEKISNNKKGKSINRSPEGEARRVAALKGITKTGISYRITKEGSSFIWEKSIRAFAESIGIFGRGKSARLYQALKNKKPTVEGWFFEKLINGIPADYAENSTK